MRPDAWCSPASHTAGPAAASRGRRALSAPARPSSGARSPAPGGPRGAAMTASRNGSRSSSRQVGQVHAEDDRLEELARARGRRGRRLEPARVDGEALALQAPTGLDRRRVVPGRRHRRQVRREGRPEVLAQAPDLREVADAAALRDELAPAPHRARMRAKSASWSRIQWKVAVETMASTGSRSSRSRRSLQITCARSAGRRSRAVAAIAVRAVDGDHAPAREARQHHLGHAAGAGAGIQHRLVAAQLEALDDGRAPLLLRCGDRVVALGVPFQVRHSVVR